MDAHFVPSSLFLLTLVALLFHLLTYHYHKLVDAAARFAALVARFAALVTPLWCSCCLLRCCCCSLCGCCCSLCFAARNFFPSLDLLLFARFFVLVLEARICSARGVLRATGASFIGAFPSRAFTVLLSIM